MTALRHIAIVCAPIACASCSTWNTDPDRAHTRGLDRADAYVGRIDTIDARAPATINGSPVAWAELAPLLAEAAGGEILREIALDRMLEDECAQRGLDPAQLADATAVSEERALLIETLLGAGVASDPDESERLLAQLRQARGLGDERFARLLRRSAILRALVRDEVVVTDEAVRTMYDLRYGPTRLVRIIVTPTLGEAQSALVRIERGEDFSRLAMEVSIDASARAGGVIAPLHRADPAWPQALRAAAFDAELHEPVGPVAVETGYVVLLIDDEALATTRPEPSAARGELVRMVRIREERRQADALARRLLARAQVEPSVSGLAWAWWALDAPSQPAR
ncbi:MAG: hypothetical protein KDA20_03800 [Phycisphaerales bacterium]|nr:hypothetical protein [Phycisphaerales bacterium]